MLRQRIFQLFIALAALCAAGFSQAGPKVKLQTSLGDILLELNTEKAPLSSENFLRYVDDGFYDGTIFHRIIPGFMVQGGGYSPDYKRKATRAEINNEAANGLKNRKYSVSMARTNAPHSATAQFFINDADNAFLDYRSATSRGWGYAVFGEVIEGQDVVDKLSAVKTGPGGPFPSDAPQEQVLILHALRIAE